MNRKDIPFLTFFSITSGFFFFSYYLTILAYHLGFQGDQASIIGGAINFVKELEQLLQSMEAHKRTTQQLNASCSSPFADFFTYPQYSSRANNCSPSSETLAENHSAIPEIEVTMVESHANLKVLTRRRPKQLLQMIAGFQNLYLTILHLNVTTMDQMVLYSFSVKVNTIHLLLYFYLLLLC